MADRKLNIIVIGKDKASGALKRVGSALGKLGKAAAVGGGLVVGATAGIGGALLKLADDAAPIEGIRDSFAGLAEDSGYSMDEMLSALQEGSMGMIRQRELMRSFNEAAQLVSTDFATRLPEAFESLRKVSAATEQDMGFLLDSLTMGVGRLSTEVLDNLNVQADLNSAYEVYAERLGKSVEELTKTEKQTALADQVMEKLRENTAAMPDITDNAATKWGQLRTKFADTKDMLGEKLLPAFGRLGDWLLTAAEKYLPPFLEWFENSFIPFVENDLIPIIEKDVVPVIEKLVGWVSSNLPVAFGLAKVAWDNVLKPALTALQGFIRDDVIPFLSKLRDWIEVNWPKAFRAARDVWNDVLKPVLEGLYEFLETQVIPRLETFWEWLELNIPKAFEKIKRWWDSSGKAIWEDIKIAFENILDVVEETVGWIWDLIEALEKINLDTLSRVEKQAGPLGQLNREGFEALYGPDVFEGSEDAFNPHNTQNIYGGITIENVGSAEELFKSLQGFMP